MSLVMTLKSPDQLKQKHFPKRHSPKTTTAATWHLLSAGSHTSCSSAVAALADVLVASLETMTHHCDLKGLFLQFSLLLRTSKCTYFDVATRWGDLSRLWECFQKVSPSVVKCERNRTLPSVQQVSRSIYNSHTSQKHHCTQTWPHRDFLLLHLKADNNFLSEYR